MMEYKPFKREEAEEIAEDFEDLPGTPLNGSQDAPDISYVLVTPFAPAKRDAYIMAYHSGVETVVPEDETEYDVAIVVMDENGDIGLCETAREYVNTRGINYHFPA